MFELIRSIPGNWFLLIYLLVAYNVIFIAKIIIDKDNTKNLEVPEPTVISPLDTAFLIKGIKRAVMVSIFNLWKAKKIEIINNNKYLIINKSSNDTGGLNNFEVRILKDLKPTKPYYKFFDKKSLNKYQKYFYSNIKRLKYLKLILDDNQLKRYKLAHIISAIVLLFAGGIKLVMGIYYDKPVSLLILFMIISYLILFVMIRPGKYQLTALGKKFIKKSVIRFEYLKIRNNHLTKNTNLQANDNSNNNNTEILINDNHLYGLAIFGITPFIHSSIGDLIYDLILLDNFGTHYNYSNSGGYSNGGCSGGGGGCSGGGGSCSSGCGGCGGGS